MTCIAEEFLNKALSIKSKCSLSFISNLSGYFYILLNQQDHKNILDIFKSRLTNNESSKQLSVPLKTLSPAYRDKYSKLIEACKECHDKILDHKIFQTLDEPNKFNDELLRFVSSLKRAVKLFEVDACGGEVGYRGMVVDKALFQSFIDNPIKLYPITYFTFDHIQANMYASKNRTKNNIGLIVKIIFPKGIKVIPLMLCSHRSTQNEFITTRPYKIVRINQPKLVQPISFGKSKPINYEIEFEIS